jgi:hypothetical protein
MISGARPLKLFFGSSKNRFAVLGAGCYSSSGNKSQYCSTYRTWYVVPGTGTLEPEL